MASVAIGTRDCGTRSGRVDARYRRRLIQSAQSRRSSIIASVLTGSMLALGFLHGLGADHLMAIAALSLATPLGPARYARAFGLAVRFAVGHAVLLALGAGLVLFFGWQIPVRFEQGGEFVGGCLLIALGLVVGWLTVSGRLYVHAHVHDAGERARTQPLAPAPRPPALPSAVDSHGAAGRARRGVRGERPARAHPVAAALELRRAARIISGRCCFSSRSSRSAS